MFTASLVTDMIGPTIAYATLRHSLWLPYLVCSISLLCTFPVLIRMPETLAKRSDREDGEAQGPLERTGLTAYFKFLRDWRILVGVVTVFLAQFRQNTIEVLLPYASVRFNLELGEVTNPRATSNLTNVRQTATMLSVVSAVNIFVFLILLPWATTFLQQKVGLSAHLVNIYTARTSSAMLAVGAAMLAAAPNVALVVFGKI